MSMVTSLASRKQSFFQPIIGLEIHIELATKSKMFCSCKAEHFGAVPNTQTCPVCLGLPGALPYPNQKAIEGTILVGLALNGQISRFSQFDRKNYFYPDLPKGYQISQYNLPLASNGKWKMENGKWIQIRRVHLEEDTGKLIHRKGDSLIDFNRSGVPLLEIVTEPDFTSASEAKVFLQKLQQRVRYLGVAEADMEKGQMRCEPNVNLKITEGGKTYFTPIVEIKNVNSFRFVQAAIEFEIARQPEEFKKTRAEKGPGNKQTRGWDETKKMTFPQREKEEAEDYRYFPEPDLPPMRLRDEDIKILTAKIPELPEQKQVRFVKEYGLTETSAQILTETCSRADYFEEVVRVAKKENLSAKELANLMVNKRLDSEKLKPEDFVKAAIAQKISVSLSEGELVKIIEKVLKENQKAVQDYQKGKTTALEFLVGQVARATKGKADPNLARKVLSEVLNSS